MPVKSYKSVTEKVEVFVMEGVGRKKLGIWGNIFKGVKKLINI